MIDIRRENVAAAWLLLVLFCLFVNGARATDRFVATNGAHISPYNLYSRAATNIQVAINVCVDDDIVWVDNGSYRITNQISITNRITVRGTNGYQNTIVYAAWPAWTTRCFYVTRTGVVDGFTISNGHISATNNFTGGAGVYIATNGTVRNCYITYNFFSGGGTNSGGGGAYILNSGTISNCMFYTNVCVTNGGGIYCFGGGGAYVFDSTIISNSAAGTYGGGIYLESTNSALINNIVSNCVISQNSGPKYGGGIALNAGQIIGGTVSENQSTIAGGGIAAYVGGYALNCLVMNNSALYAGGIYAEAGVTNCTIVGNRNTGSSGGKTGGGGLFLNTTNATADRCVISNNLSSYGGGGGVLITNNGLLRNSLVCNNTNLATGGDMGGGGVLLAQNGLSPYGLMNCTVVNNYSTNDGGGVATYLNTNYIANCIIYNNSCSSNNYPDVFNTGSNSNNYYYTCAGALLAPNQGNITSNPAFVNSGARNWRLSGNSPCVNAGTNMSWMTGASDLDGRARIRYLTNDMGAYERVHDATFYQFKR